MIRQISYEDGKRKMAQGIGTLCHVLSAEGNILVNGRFSMSASEVAKELEGKDYYVNQGIRLASAAIQEINTLSGCGTRETASMMKFLLPVCQRREASGISPVYFAKCLKSAALSLEESVRQSTHPARDSRKELLTRITNDPNLADLILSGMEAGELVVKESMNAETKLEITEGMRLDGPLAVGTCGTFYDVRVLVVNRSISSFQEIYPLLTRLKGERLLILTDQIEGEAKNLLAVNTQKNHLPVWAGKIPGIGRRKEDLMGDTAVLTNTTVFDGIYPCPMKEISLHMLGKAKTLTVTPGYIIIEGSLKREPVFNRIHSIEERINQPETNYYDKQKLRERIAGLKEKAPVIYVGGQTLTQSKDEKRKVEYAVAYAQTMDQYGIVSKEDLASVFPGSETETILLESIIRSLKEEAVSTWLLILMIKKVTGLLVMWLTTGAVMVSTGYDREDLELMKNGVDIERLRG
ncbi:hypothetical protein [Clostridium sp. HBUAS56010]|uniref:hypothetical protein n=1 Tax=Clostridium sp. HBUAS56010 TaxID=2571127 RepID=UPI0011781042|nr:hypothetical protein [Clostridium sp. HBUAS56010]